ncbi:GHKL domain-containing protein, partial [Candidatus Saccharibacteria bacterium]|nr:GHKL domain-containing protein [Fodinibius sp.]NIV99450.1 GHKL domain-containing protein [Candidatus Saccharibacteria bacterium]
KPTKFGDDLSKFRKTVFEANRALTPITGVEVGRAGAGLRIVYPVFYQNKHIGSVEIGASLAEVLKASVDILEAEYAVGIYRQVFDNARRFKSGSSDILVDDLVYSELSNPDLRKVLLLWDGKKINVAGRIFMGEAIPLTDFQGEKIGQIVIFKDVTTLLADQREELLSSIAFILFFTALLCTALILLIRKAYVKPLKQAVTLADALNDGDLDYQLEVNGNSEFKRMLKGFYGGLQNLKRMQAETIRSAQLASIGELSASVAHEINNPISGVINYSQILLNQKDLNDKQYDLVNRIQKEGVRVADIVHNLLNYARDSKGVRSQHDIKEIVIDSLVLLNPKVKQCGVDVAFKWPEVLPPVFCNVQQIEQVLVNIFRNAYQAMEKNAQDDRKIEVKAEVLKANKCDVLQLVIANNGPHIPHEILDKVLEPFFTTKPIGVGTGLGLSVSATIMREHDGKLEVRSDPGKMTEMILQFPVETV